VSLARRAIVAVIVVSFSVAAISGIVGYEPPPVQRP
jgi:hypothetical protein